jgi:hypothetical protein
MNLDGLPHDDVGHEKMNMTNSQRKIHLKMKRRRCRCEIILALCWLVAPVEFAL